MARRVSPLVRRRRGREEPPVAPIPRQPARDTSPAADVLDTIDEVLTEE